MTWTQTCLALAAAAACSTGCKQGPPPTPSSAPASAPTSVPASAPASRTSGTTPERRNDVDADGVVRRGVAVPENAIGVKTLLDGASSYAGQTVTVAGEVTQVCAKKGCWMALRSPEGGPTVRVTAQKYAYFVPEEATGMKAKVHGMVSVQAVDLAAAEHYAAESGDETKAKPGPEVSIVSVGLELRR